MSSMRCMVQAPRWEIPLRWEQRALCCWQGRQYAALSHWLRRRLPMGTLSLWRVWWGCCTLSQARHILIPA